MSIKYIPLGDFPYSSSFAVTSSFAEKNIGGILNNASASFVESASFSLTQGITGPAGKDLVIVASLIELPD